MILQASGAAADIKEYVQLALSGLTLVGVLFGAFRVVNIAQKGVDAHENRIQTLEAKMGAIETLTVQVTALTASFAEVTKEMERMRNRLDRFLDTQSATRLG